MSEIIQDTVVRKIHHPGFPRKILPFIIAVHASAGGRPDIWIRDAERLKNPRLGHYKKGIALWNFTLLKSGGLFEMIDRHNWTYGSNGGSKHEPGIISVEIEHSDNGKTPFLDIQYKALFFLFDELFRQFPITEISSHNILKQRFSGKSKICPGPGFEWDKISEYLTSSHYDFDIQHESCDNIREEKEVMSDGFL